MTRYENKRGRISVPTEADMGLNEGVVSEKVLNAYRKASAHLTKLGVPHLVVGGLAVGAWGHPRATRDIDFLVRASDAFDGQLILTFKPGIPIEVDGVAIDYLTVESLKVRGPKEIAPNADVVPIELLFAMKLRVKRMQDDADIVSLIRAGADVDAIREWLEQHGFAPESLRLLKLQTRAAAEK